MAIHDDPYQWVTEDHKLKHQRDLEELAGDPRQASSGNAYSWIKKRQTVAELAGNSTRILEIGCGWGRNLPSFRTAIGLDISLPFLKTARNYVSNDLVLGDANALPFRDGTFELVIMTEVIEHLDEPSMVLREIRRVLVSQGRLVLSTPNKALSGLARVPGHISEMTFGELAALLTREGFLPLRRTGSTIPYIPSYFRWSWIDRNPLFFTLWKALDFVCRPLRFLRWDLIVLAERSEH